MDSSRRGRAAGEIVRPAFLERQVALDEIDDIDPGEQVLDEGLRDHVRSVRAFEVLP